MSGKTFLPPSTVVDHILAAMSHLEGTNVADLANVFLVCKDLTRTPRLVDSMMHADLGFNDRIVVESFCRASQCQNVDVVRLLLKEHGDSAIITSNSLLRRAIVHGQVHILRVLLEHGVIITPDMLHLAIIRVQVDILRVLLEHGGGVGGDVEAITFTEIMMAILMSEHAVETCGRFGLDVSSPEMLEVLASGRNRVDILSVLLEHVHAITPEMLQCAIGEDRVDALRVLLQHRSGSAVELITPEIIQRAIDGNRVEIVRAFFEHVGGGGDTPLGGWILRNAPEMLE